MRGCILSYESVILVLERQSVFIIMGLYVVDDGELTIHCSKINFYFKYGGIGEEMTLAKEVICCVSILMLVI